MTHGKYNIFTLPNGMRCVHQRTDGNVSYIGVVVGAGARDDFKDRPGTAHFVEHTIFKGTGTRSSWNISNCMETIGGELNAYTTKEETVFYTVAPAGYAARAISLLADLLANATFDSEELAREEDVIIEEINSYLDSPGDKVFDNFEDLIYAGSDMGHNILGTVESVRSISHRTCLDFIEDFYTPDNMVLYCADPSPYSKIERLALAAFGQIRPRVCKKGRKAPGMVDKFHICEDNNGHQCHTVVGGRVCDRYAEERFPLFLLNNCLGGPGMNSRLNQHLREKLGLVYTVESSLALMSDCGLMTIYLGSDRTKTSRCLRIIARELEKLASSPLKPLTFERMKRQYIGQHTVMSDNRESTSMLLGKTLSYYNEIHDIDWTVRQISEVTAEQMRMVAEKVAAAVCSSLTVC